MDPTAFRERFKAWKEGKPITDIYDRGLPKYDTGTNLYRRPDGSFFYQNSPDDEEIDVTPQYTVFDDPSMWTFVDKSGKTYTPKKLSERDPGTIVEDTRNAGQSFWDNYIGELKYNINNDRVLGGKYTLPAIGLGALGLYGAAAAGGAMSATPTLAEATSLVGQNVWRNGLLKFGTSMLTGEAFNEASKLTTGSSWGQNINNITQGYVPTVVGDFSNPGYAFTGESVANKIANTDFAKMFRNSMRFVRKQITAESRAEQLSKKLLEHKKNTERIYKDRQDQLNLERDNAERHYRYMLDKKEEETNKISTKLEKTAIKAGIAKHASDNDFITSFIMQARGKRLHPVVKQTMKNKNIHPDLVAADDEIERILKTISEGGGNSVDFSKMSAKDVVRLIKYTQDKAFRYSKTDRGYELPHDFPETYEGLVDLLKQGGVEFDENGRVIDQFGIIPFDKIFKTGQFKIPLFEGGAVEGSVDVTNPGKQTFSNLSDIISAISDPYRLIRRIEKPGEKYSAQIPEEYPEALKRNINWLVQKFGGSKPFGSSVTSAYSGTPHITHDIDLIMSEEDFAKNVESALGKRTEQGWSVNSKPNFTGFEDTYTYNINPSMGDAGNIDFNIIYADPNTGMASSERGTRALELFRQFFPEDYRIAVQESLRTGNPIQINKTPKELIDAYNPVQKTILDALSSSKPKHVSRAEAHLTTTNPKDVEKALDLYLQEKTGGLGHHIPVTEDMFYNVERNSRIFDELGYKGVDKETVIKDPLKMKNLVDYWYIHNSVYGRGVYTDNLVERDGLTKQELIDNAYREWIGKGGNANGAGLNAVTLGDSGYGDVYGYIQPNVNYDLLDNVTNDPEVVINFAKRAIGHPSYRLSNEEKSAIESILSRYGVSRSLEYVNTPEELLKTIPYDIDIKPVLQEINDILGIRSLQKADSYGNARYVSITGKVSQKDAVSYDVRRRMEMPVSDIFRDKATKAEDLVGYEAIQEGFKKLAKMHGSKKLMQDIIKSGLVSKKIDQNARFEIYQQLRIKMIDSYLRKKGITENLNYNSQKYEKARKLAEENADEMLNFLETTQRRFERAQIDKREIQINKEKFATMLGVIGVPSAVFVGASTYSKNKRKKRASKQKDNSKTE